MSNSDKKEFAQLDQRLGENTQPLRIDDEKPEIEAEDIQNQNHISQQRRR